MERMNEYKHKSHKKGFFYEQDFFLLNSQRKVTALPLKKKFTFLTQYQPKKGNLSTLVA